jgi:hypothetical protein
MKDKNEELLLMNRIVNKAYPRILRQLMSDLNMSEGDEIDNNFILSFFGSLFLNSLGQFVIYDDDLSPEKKADIYFRINETTTRKFIEILDERHGRK